MDKQTQSIRRQSDKYVDESELPFTASSDPTAEDAESTASRRAFDGETPGPRIEATREPGDNIESGAE